MQLFEKKYQWTSQDSQTDVSFCFHVPEGLEQIRIRFTFSPGTESDPKICLPEIEGAMNRYYDRFPRDLQPMKKESFLPVKNLITISLDKDGMYLGNAHRWATTQEHLISVNQVSRGFLPPEKMEGEWHGMLHLHEILSKKCSGHLIVEGGTKA